jgi:hypothetical protein
MTPWAVAWLALCLALAVHVADEALTDFLSVYNPAVLAIRRRLPFVPLPTFSFRLWLTGLVLGTFLLLGLTPFAARAAAWMAPVSYAFAALMIGNGLLHLAGSLISRRWLPGAISSPVLVAAAVCLLVYTPAGACWIGRTVG